jgi:hypothetical protein
MPISVRLIATVIAVGALLSACGDPSPHARLLSEPAIYPVDTYDVAHPKISEQVDTCDLVTLAEARTLIGPAAAAVAPASGADCSYQSPGQQVNIIIGGARSVDAESRLFHRGGRRDSLDGDSAWYFGSEAMPGCSYTVALNPVTAARLGVSTNAPVDCPAVRALTQKVLDRIPDDLGTPPRVIPGLDRQRPVLAPDEQIADDWTLSTLDDPRYLHDGDHPLWRP